MRKSAIKDLLCPSHKCMEGSLLLGVRQRDGSVAILNNPLEIDQTFINNFRKNGDEPEQQFRFANKCMKGACKQWTGKECGVATHISQMTKHIPDQHGLPHCPIRYECRWHKQEGDKICYICPNVITTVTEKEIDDYFKCMFKSNI